MPREGVVSLPEWLPLETWQEFLKMRVKIKKPATDYAKKLLINKLTELRAQGHPPQAVLDQSIMNCYQGLFSINGNGHHKRGLDLDELYPS